MEQVSQVNASRSHAPRVWWLVRRHRWIVWVIFLLSLVHRLVGLGAVPKPHATNDEYFYFWAGMSVMEGEAPRSWSLLEVAQDRVLGVYYTPEAGYPIVQPVFDHPPMFQYLTGITGKLVGAEPFTAGLDKPIGSTTLWDAPLWKLRLLPIALYALSFWLLWGWLRLAGGPLVALIAVTCFAFFRHIVMHQRLVVSDNMVTPMLLAVLWAMERWRRGWTSPRKAAVAVAFAMAAAVSSKLVALSAVAAVFGWSGSLFRGRAAMRPCGWAILGAIGGVAFTLIFAAVHGFDAFMVTMRSQAIRFYDLGGFLDIVRFQPLVHEYTHSDWIVSAWLFVPMLLVTTRGGHQAVYVALIGYVFAYLFFAPVDHYGWHMLPFFPFLCAAWGSALRHVFRRPGALESLLVLVLLIAAAFNPFFETVPSLRGVGRYVYMVFAVLALFPWGFSFDNRRKTIIRYMVLVLLIIGLSQEITRLVSMQLHADV